MAMRIVLVHFFHREAGKTIHRLMKTRIKTRLGCFSVILFFIFLIVLFSFFREELDRLRWGKEVQGIAWGPAMEMCKERYKSLDSPGRIKVPNCKKRTETDMEHTFSWSYPVGIFIKKDPDSVRTSKGTCVVSKQTGEITYLSLGDRVIVGGSRE